MSGNQAGTRRVADLSDEKAEQVVDILERYLAELQAGTLPNLEEWVSQYPEFADMLTEYLPELEQIHLGASVPEPGDAEGELPVFPDSEQGRLGDFKIQREVGRGGMGVVYEAEQISLGRRVALKVLPFAATLDPKQLQRFKNEAQAAAQLHHSNIVPVYAVGCSRGVHFYAMQFIEGQSLAEMIAELRADVKSGLPRTSVDPPPPEEPGGKPAQSAPEMVSTRTHAALATDRSSRSAAYFRSIAELGVEAALALEHAHQLGVVHRDIKPANLLVDAAGHLWITDFGLAQFQNEHGLTLSGDIVGTVRYMSPEQAFARRGLVDHRTDIYSLGITLYEALTLEPAYAGTDREAILKRIALNDPRPPRRAQPLVPVELETIVLKAMADRPESRYATAQEMADDLRRFLENRPILAVRPTLIEKATKWAGRHKPVLTTAAAALGLLMVGLIVGTFLLWRERDLTQAALVEARTQEELAKSQAAEVRAQKERAQKNFELALGGAMRLMVRLEDKRYDPMPLIGELRRSVISEGMGFYQGFIHEESADPAVLWETARAYYLIAVVHCAGQQVAKAKEALGRSAGIWERLAAESEVKAPYRQELDRVHYLRGLLCTSNKEPGEARAAYRAGIEQLDQCLSDDADGKIANNLAWRLVDCPDTSLRDIPRALSLARQAVATKPGEGNFWNTLGVALYRNGDFRAAKDAFARSMELNGGDAHDWFFLAMACWRLSEKSQARGWSKPSPGSINSRPRKRTFSAIKRKRNQ
jgi:eukaryotic-like serine/threonine-protein kinase